MSTPDHEYADPWDVFRARVVAALADVVGDPSAFLLTEGPVIEIDPGLGIFGRRRKPVRVRAQVAALPLEDGVLLLQSVLADPGPKDFPVDAYARRAMQAAGWNAPGDPSYFSLAEDPFTVRMPAGDPHAVADLAARTYPILGVTDPASVAVEVSCSTTVEGCTQPG